MIPVPTASSAPTEANGGRPVTSQPNLPADFFAPAATFEESFKDAWDPRIEPWEKRGSAGRVSSGCCIINALATESMTSETQNSRRRLTKSANEASPAEKVAFV